MSEWKSPEDLKEERFQREVQRGFPTNEPEAWPPEWEQSGYPSPHDPPSLRLPFVLFLLTVFTTLWAGAYQANLKPVSGAWDFLMSHPEDLYRGLPFAGTLLGILVTHEFGHYILSRIHRVPASLPLFIPGPPQFIGTFGAIIRMRSPTDWPYSWL